MPEIRSFHPHSQPNPSRPALTTLGTEAYCPVATVEGMANDRDARDPWRHHRRWHRRRARYEGDVAIVGDEIAAIGRALPKGDREIDARGKLVTPGFVDIHTHYDAQVTWADRISPSSWNGVTTVLIGNCGVGFAPCRPEQRDMLVKLMEGVEDIPEVVLTEGLPWNWQTFPRISRRARRPPLRHRRGDAGAALGGARLCHGRARRQPGTPRPRMTATAWAHLVAEGHAGRRARLLPPPAPSPTRPSRANIFRPCARPRRS